MSKVYECGNYRIHTIKINKFKTTSLEIIFRKKIEKEKITEYNLLARLLSFTSKKYPRERDITIELEKLYNAYEISYGTVAGNTQKFSVMIDFLNPKYCEEGYLEEVVSFPFELLLNPKIEDNHFCERDFLINKNRMIAAIESEKESPYGYSMHRSLGEADSNNPSSYDANGYLEDLENITPESLVNTYNNLFKDFNCDIYVCGNVDMNKIVKIIKKIFKNETAKRVKIDMYYEGKARNKNKDIVETGKYEQDIITMVYNMVDFTDRERKYVLPLFNNIFGGYELTSKLYRYLREENSLCYNVSSMINRFVNTFIVRAGIDAVNKDFCIELVNKALKEMKQGEFSDDDLANAKKTRINEVIMADNSNAGYISREMLKELDGFTTIKEAINNYKSVTKEEIMNVVDKLVLNTIYLLKGEE